MTTPEAAPMSATTRPVSRGLILVAWLWVTVPLAYAVWQLLTKITQLFST